MKNIEDGYGGIDCCPRCDCEVLRARMGADVLISTTVVPVRDARVLQKYQEPVYAVWKRRGRGYWVSYWYGEDPAPARLYAVHRCGYWP